MDENSRDRVERMHEDSDSESDISILVPDGSLPPHQQPPIILRRTRSNEDGGGGLLRQQLRPILHFLRRERSDEDSANDDEQDDNNEESSVLGRVVNFDTELPTEHSYLGNMTQVPGVGYLEAGKYYNMLIFVHHSIVFPGETLPMIIPHYLFDPTLFSDEAVVFGITFPKMWKTTKPRLYGVTCQIFEKRTDEYNNVIIKCRVHQRFVITKKLNKNFSELLEPLQRKVYAKVLILPEITLPDPLYALDLGSMNRFRGIDTLDNKLRQIQASTTIWPQFVYEQYKIESIIERAKKYIASYKIKTMPTDITCMSFWLCRNLIFDSIDRIKVFTTNSVNIRLQIIDKSLDYKRCFCCTRCKNQIANCSSLFAMSKHGVQTHYCNPSGIIHETNTVYELKENAVYFSGPMSTEFSWFPGYSWQILLCRHCGIHIGWQFQALKANLAPKCFYALSGVNVILDPPSTGELGIYDSVSTESDRDSDNQDQDSADESDDPE